MIEDLNDKQEKQFRSNKDVQEIKKMIREEKNVLKDKDAELSNLISQMPEPQKKVFLHYQKKMNVARKEMNTDKLMQIQSDLMKAIQKLSHAGTDSKQ